MIKIKNVNFRPLPGLSSRHLQTILSICRPYGSPPPSKSWVIELGKQDRLCCEVSVPLHWNKKTVVLVHGLGGSHSSSYMVRLSRKFYFLGNKVVRINLRGCGSGIGLSQLPYNAGNSEDVFKVIQALKNESPDSEISLMGFSMGGNITLKLAGELGRDAEKFVKTFVAVCPPLDLAHTVQNIATKRYLFYHKYYLKQMCHQARTWTPKNVKSVYDFDTQVTAPLWGYKGPEDYYQSCSSLKFLPHIHQESHVLLAEDDPFVSTKVLKGLHLPNPVNIWTSKHGGHLGFLGYTEKEHNFNWLDQLLLNWVEGDYTTNRLLT